jgi:hypothetical protein
MRMRAIEARTHPVSLFMGIVFSLRELKICQTKRSFVKWLKTAHML